MLRSVRRPQGQTLLSSLSGARFCSKLGTQRVSNDTPRVNANACTSSLKVSTPCQNVKLKKKKNCQHLSLLKCPSSNPTQARTSTHTHTHIVCVLILYIVAHMNMILTPGSIESARPLGTAEAQSLCSIYLYLYMFQVSGPPLPPMVMVPLPLWCGVGWFGFELSWWMLTKSIFWQVMECPLPLWCGGVGLASASVEEAVVVVLNS